MGRGSTQILIRKIITSLAKSPKSIKEIVKDIELDRTAISKYLNLLKESGLIIEESEGTSKIFTMVPTYRKDTYFGLPLKDDFEKNFQSLYYLIKKNWQEQTSKPLLRTHAQKIAYKVISSCENLNLPFGWYMYGGIGVISYDDSEKYSYSGLPKNVEECVKETTIDYARNDMAWKSKQQQYEDEKKELYITKEKILSILYSPKFDTHPKNSLYVLIKKLRKLVSLSPVNTETKYIEILESYQDLMSDIVNQLKEEIILEKKREITILFEAIWKYIALFNFKQDLSTYYSPKILEIHFKLDILQQEDEIIELGTELQYFIPEDEIIDPIKKQLHETLSQIKLFDIEEQKVQKEKLKKLKKELGLEKFNEYLRKEIGLY